MSQRIFLLSGLVTMALLAVACTPALTGLTSGTAVTGTPPPATATIGKATSTPAITNADPWAPTLKQLQQGRFTDPTFPRISVQKAYELLNSSNPPVFADVRAPADFDIEHLPGATNVPVYAAPDTRSTAAHPAYAAWSTLPKNKLIIFYCDCPEDGEAAVAAERFVSFNQSQNWGFNSVNIKVLWKGLAEWDDLGYRVEAS